MGQQQPKTAHTWKVLHRELHLDQPMIMGILNVTPDSFSDGGKYPDVGSATDQALAMVEQGATIIDIGGESTRPGADNVSIAEEMDRVLPVIEALQKHSDTLLSIDTRKADVAAACIDAGAHIVNDVSGGTFDQAMFPLLAKTGSGYVMMHSQGLPADMQRSPEYGNVVEEIDEYFAHQLEVAASKGVDPVQIILDPGIGFGKTLEHNLSIMGNMDLFQNHDRPLMLGASRKSFINMLDGSEVSRRLAGSIAAVLSTYNQGVRLFRVHDVHESRQALHIFNAIQAHSG